MKRVDGQSMLIRADSGPDIGVGHVMRCLALAQAWMARGGVAFFVASARNSAVEARLRADGIEMIVWEMPPASPQDLQATLDLAAARRVRWVVLDGYRFGPEYQAGLLTGPSATLVLDDFVHQPQYHATALLNQNLHATDAAYENRAPGARRLLGSRYVLLRREFWSWRGRIRAHRGTVRRAVVTLGGADADNVTGKVIQGLLPLLDGSIELVVVLGPNNPHTAELANLTRHAGPSLRIERNVPDMTQFLAEADLAVCGGGATCWEMAFFGVPILPIVLAENQVPIAASLDAAGVAVNLGWHDRLQSGAITEAARSLLGSPSRLRQMSERGRSLIDGHGADRVCDALLVRSE